MATRLAYFTLLLLATGCSSSWAPSDGGGGGDDVLFGDLGHVDARRVDSKRTDGKTSVGDVGSVGLFSFFVTSLKAMRDFSGNQLGFGGDLRYGETGAGAGLRGADKICAAIAERSLAGSGSRTWRAFLSATADENSKQVNAIDRVGNGPWYDRLGRVVAKTKTDLLSTRPATADTTIKNDLPNEDGVPNHNPDGTKVDNHDILTGTNASGKLYGSKSTCLDWTSKLGNKTTEGVPHCGHSWPTGGGGGGGGGDGMSNWMSALDEAGCSPAVYLIDDGAAKPGSTGVGSGGGYGGIYCFVYTP
jgi:hypothetical protein